MDWILQGAGSASRSEFEDIWRIHHGLRMDPVSRGPFQHIDLQLLSGRVFLPITVVDPGGRCAVPLLARLCRVDEFPLLAVRFELHEEEFAINYAFATWMTSFGFHHVYLEVAEASHAFTPGAVRSTKLETHLHDILCQLHPILIVPVGPADLHQSVAERFPEFQRNRDVLVPLDASHIRPEDTSNELLQGSHSLVLINFMFRSVAAVRILIDDWTNVHTLVFAILPALIHI
mmetsp:Transcript_39124/g.64524  ORF Transcript_39124/g.64524 Transcript_39124/m.64524 type:complete len:232 (-) Transcript_39124:147-842(-)